MATSGLVALSLFNRCYGGMVKTRSIKARLQASALLRSAPQGYLESVPLRDSEREEECQNSIEKDLR